MTDTDRLSGKVAVVSGGARGLGAGITRELVRHGAAVVVADVLRPEGERLVEELGPSTRFAELDVTSAPSWAATVTAAEHAFGPLSVLVNNAGIVTFGPAATLSEADYRRVVDVNQLGVLLGMQAALPSMRRAGRGSMVNVSSVAGLGGYPGILAYVASKWAVRGMSKAAALEFAADGVRVNSVHPGTIDTPMTAGQGTPKGNVLGRKGRPEEVGSLVVYLASDESSFCTGSEFVVDGGETAWTGGELLR